MVRILILFLYLANFRFIVFITKYFISIICIQQHVPQVLEKSDSFIVIKDQEMSYCFHDSQELHDLFCYSSSKNVLFNRNGHYIQYTNATDFDCLGFVQWLLLAERLSFMLYPWILWNSSPSTASLAVFVVAKK